MKGEAYIYKLDGTIEHKEFNSMVPLDVIKDAVGGWIETVPYWNKHHGKPCVAFCNEEGKLEGLEYNVHATAVWYVVAPQMRGLDVLVGNIIVIQGDKDFMREL